MKIQAAFYFIDFLLRLPIDLTTKLHHSLIPFMQKEEKGMVKFSYEDLSPTWQAYADSVRENMEEKIIEEVAIEMLKKGTTIDFIAEVTGLSLAQVETLQKSLDSN